MSTKLINHTYRLKRGHQDAVERVDPLLDPGEPIVVFCNDGKTRMKVGDGTSRYSELDFIGGGDREDVVTYPNRYDFPQPPPPKNIHSIFKATNEAKLWQWNEFKHIYEALDNLDVDISLDDIDAIFGGNATDIIKELNK